jgi:agmatinase
MEGPIGVRNGLAAFRNWSVEEGFAYTDHISYADIGNLSVVWNDYDKTYENIDKAISVIGREGKFPIIFGGDHSITYQIIKTMAEMSGKKLGIIWLDNHYDAMEIYRGDTRYCGCMMWHLLDEFPNQINPKNIVHIGSRGFHGGTVSTQNVINWGVNVISAEQVHIRGMKEVAEEAIRMAHDGVDLVYLTCDIDVLEASMAPGTQCPNPGGLFSTQLFYMIRQFAKSGLVGFDVMEVAPYADYNDITQQAAAITVLEVLTGLAYRKKNGKNPYDLLLKP